MSQQTTTVTMIHLHAIVDLGPGGRRYILDPVTGITEITKITEITTEITEITMEIPEITIKGWGGGDVWCGGVGRCE